jgi:hypothetical protein
LTAELDELRLLLSWLIELLMLVRSLFRLGLLAAGATVTVGVLVVEGEVLAEDVVDDEPVALGLLW